MNSKSLKVALLILFGFCLYWNIRQGKDWWEKRESPLTTWLDEISRTLPPDARLLLVAPANDYGSDYYRVNTRLHPRVAYFLPQGARSMEEAKDWVSAKKLDWVISLGAKQFNPEKAYVRKLDDPR